MAILNGCQYGIAGVGGRPKQCTDPVERSVTVRAADRPGLSTIPLCLAHVEQLKARKIGTAYKEPEGIPTPVKMTWAER